jgi:hypothetical protein
MLGWTDAPSNDYASFVTMKTKVAEMVPGKTT